MRLVFTEEELERYRKTWDCTAFDCREFFCNHCPIAALMDTDIDKEFFIESHLEKK